MDPEVREQADKKNMFTKDEYCFKAEVGQGIAMPKEQSYKIKFAIRDNVWTTGDSKHNGTYSFWGERLEATWSMLPTCTKVKDAKVPKLFIYLMDGDTPISHTVVSMLDLMKPEAQWKWVQFARCPVINEVANDYEAGLISIKMSIHRMKNDPELDLSTYNAWQVEPITEYAKRKVRCYIFQCRDLPSADDDGSSDPFLQIFNTDGDDVRSSVIDDNLNPIYYESRTFDYEFNNIKDAPPVIISAFDTDAGFISSSNDYLARAVIHLDSAAVNHNES
jgi:metal-sulfur cluster biosynthetic enzyme